MNFKVAKRILFALILLLCTVVAVLDIWDKHEEPAEA